MTTRQELIERLKSNRTPFKWLTDDERSVLSYAKKQGMALYLRYSDRWEPDNGSAYYASNIYRIHKDYTEESERPDVPYIIPGVMYENEILNMIQQDINKLNKCIQWLYDKVERIESNGN